MTFDDQLVYIKTEMKRLGNLFDIMLYAVRAAYFIADVKVGLF